MTGLLRLLFLGLCSARSRCYEYGRLALLPIQSEHAQGERMRAGLVQKLLLRRKKTVPSRGKSSWSAFSDRVRAEFCGYPKKGSILRAVRSLTDEFQCRCLHALTEVRRLSRNRQKQGQFEGSFGFTVSAFQPSRLSCPPRFGVPSNPPVGVIPEGTQAKAVHSE